MEAGIAKFSISHGYSCVMNLQLFYPERRSLRRSFCPRMHYFNTASVNQLHSVKKYPRFFFKCAARNTDPITYEDTVKSVSREILVWRAIKLPIYTVALIPITVGSAAAYRQTGLYFGKRYLMLLISAVLVIAWLNLSNDVYDSETGVDENKKESVVKLVGSRTGVHVIAWLLLALGITGLGFVAVEAQNLNCAFLLSGSIACGYVYQCPPFRLSYKGVGEPLCFAAFGPLATIAFYLLQTGTRAVPISNTIVCSSLLIGLTTTLILFCSHFHQIEDDKAVGKLSPLVRLGTNRGADIVKVGVFALYSGLLVSGLNQALPFSSVVLCGLTLPMGLSVVNFVRENHMDKEKIFMAKYYCVRLHTLFGGALALGLVLARLFVRKKLPHALLL